MPTPLNVGPTGQSKEGGLILNTGGAEYGLIVDQGNVEFGGALILNPAGRSVSPVEGQIYFDQGDKKMYYYNGVEWIELAVTAPQECGVCMIWSSEAGKCVPLPAGTKDEYCSSLHYTCDGAGNCTSPKGFACIDCPANNRTSTGYDLCLVAGYDGCIRTNSPKCSGAGVAAGPFDCNAKCHARDWEYPASANCWYWVYD